MGDVTDEAAATTGIDEVRRAVRRADRRASSSTREAIVTGPAADDRVVDPRRARAADRRAGPAGAGRGRGQARLGARTSRSGAAPACAEIGNRLGWLTISEQDARAAPATCARSPTQVKADGFTDAVLLGMGGSSLGPEVIRRSLRRDRRTALRLHVLDSTDPGAVLRRRASGRPRQDAVHRLLEVRRDDRDALAHALLLRAHRPRRAAASCAVTDPGSPLIDAGQRARLPARVRERPGHRRALLGAVVLRARAGRAGGRGRRGACCDRAQVAEQNCTQYELGAANSGLWLGLRAGRAGAAGPRQAHVRRRPSRSRASASGSSSWSPSRPASRARASCRWPTSRSATPEAYGDDRVFVYLRNAGRARRGAGREDRGARARPATRCITLAVHGAADLGRIFFFAEFATAVAGWALGINPFDQPNVQEAKDNTAQGARGRRPAGGGPGRPRGAARAGGAAALRGDHGLRRRRPRSSTRPSRSCARAIRDAHEGDDHVRLRPALPALDRPVPQGRPADRPVPPARTRRRRGRGDPGGRLHVRAPEERAGDRRPADAARPRPAGGARSRLEGDPARRRD